MGSEMSLNRSARSYTSAHEAEEVVRMEMSAKKKQCTVPLSTLDVSIVLPMILELKHKLAALEATISNANDPQLKATVEKTLTQLENTTDYEEVLQSTQMLQEFLSDRCIHSYGPHLIDKADRIFHLLAQQLATNQLIYSDQDIVDHCSVLINNFYLALRRLILSPYPFGKQLTDKTLEKLVFAILPHIDRPKSHCNIFNNCAKLVFFGSCPSFEMRDKVLTILLRHYRYQLEQSLKEDVDNRLAWFPDLLEDFVRYTHGCLYSGIDRRHLKHLDTVLFELYKLFDVYSDITLSPDMNFKPLETFKEVAYNALRRLCSNNEREGVPSDIWDEAFALIDCELRQLRRSKKEVPFYKWLAGQKIKRAVAMETLTEALDSSGESASTAEEVIAVDDETASNASLVVINSVEPIDLIPESEVAEAVGDSGKLIKPLKCLNSLSILEQEQQWQAENRHLQEIMVAKFREIMFADKKN